MQIFTQVPQGGGIKYNKFYTPIQTFNKNVNSA